MTLNRYAKRRDNAERDCIDELKANGAYVVPCDKFDLLVGYRRRWVTWEVKSKGGKETDWQHHHRQRCEADALPHIVYREGESVVNCLDYIVRTWEAPTICLASSKPAKASRRR